MNTKERLEKDLLDAMRNKDEARKKTIRMAISSIKLAEVEKGGELDDSLIMPLLHKEIKMRHETIEEAIKGNRDNIIKEAEAEIEILEKYLPKPLSEDELKDLARGVVNDLNANSIKDMGNVMKILIPMVQCRASNELVSQVVRNLLQNS